MAAKRKRIPRYSKVQINGHEYYETDIEEIKKNQEEIYEGIRKILTSLSKIE